MFSDGGGSTLRSYRFLSLYLAAVLLVMAALAPAAASAGSPPPAPAGTPAAPPFRVNALGAVLLDARSGQVLFSQDGDKPLVPASLTKVMTLRLTFKAIKEGRIHLDDQVAIGPDAWAQKVGGSVMFLAPNTTVRLEELIKGITVDSGNDACVAVADRLGGSADGFVAMMNEEARRLGLKNTHYVDPNGLSSENHISPLDMARLAQAYIRDYPDALTYHSIRSFTYGGIKQDNRNGLLDTYPGADGLKTGYTDEAGYNLVATAHRGDMRMIAVVMGVPGKGLTEAEVYKLREDQAAKLLSYGFDSFADVEFKAGADLGRVPVYKGKASEVGLTLGQDVLVTVPRDDQGKLAKIVSPPAYLVAPVARGQAVGEFKLSLPSGQEILTAPLVAAQDVPRGGFFRVFWDSLKLLLKRLLHR